MQTTTTPTLPKTQEAGQHAPDLSIGSSDLPVADNSSTLALGIISIALNIPIIFTTISYLLNASAYGASLEAGLAVVFLFPLNIVALVCSIVGVCKLKSRASYYIPALSITIISFVIPALVFLILFLYPFSG